MENIIEVSNLMKSFPNIVAVNDITFHVQKGELYGFLGINGAGKSTTINMLSTLLMPNSGEVLICGHVLGKENQDIRRKIGIVFQENSLDDRLTVKENLEIRAALYESDTSVINKILIDVCEVLDINDIINTQFIKLSGGQKRRCEIARALMNRPEILFLDEPTTGLDPQTRQNVWNSIEMLRQELNMTVFLTTHYMEEAAKSQYIAIMEAGKIVAKGTPSQLKSEYACDLLRIVPHNFDQLKDTMIKHNIDYQEEANLFKIRLENTKASLAILDIVRDDIDAFEVIQGTMDDVFLSITGKQF